MFASKFIKNLQPSFLQNAHKENKNHSLTRLIEKLEKRKETIMQALVSTQSKELEEELQIVTLLIQKGKNKLS